MTKKKTPAATPAAAAVPTAAQAIEPPIHGACHGCDTHQVQFVTRGGTTTLRCKICDSQVEPADEGEAQSLADYNKTA